LIISLSILRMRNFSDKICRESQNTPFTLIFFLNHTTNEVKYKNVVDPDRPQIIWRMRIACWISKAKDAYS